MSKARLGASKGSGHAGARDIVSIQELYPFLLKAFASNHILYFIIYLSLLLSIVIVALLLSVACIILETSNKCN